MEQVNEIMKVNPKSTLLVEKWGERVELVEDVMDKELSFDRKYSLAACLENTQMALQLLETTQSSDVGPYKKFALDLITAVVPNLIAHDIVSVQPIDHKVGMINYIKYLYGSQKGNINKGDEITSPLAYSRDEHTYSSEFVEQEVLGADGDTAYTGNLSYVPVRPGTVSITVDAVEITDDGEGGLSATSGLTGASHTINYETGQFSFTLASSAGESPVANYEFNLEHVPSTIPQVDIKIESLPVLARSRKLRALYAFDSAFDLRRSYGGDIDSLLSSQIAAEIAHEIDAEIMNDLLTQANAGPEFTFDKTPPTAITVADHYESLYPKLTEASNTIFGATRRASGNFLVVGTTAASIVEVMRGFISEAPASPVGPHRIGTLGGMVVYKNPFYPPNSILMGYRGASYFEAGYFYCPYMPIVTTDLVMLDDFVGRRGWATSYAKKMVNNKLYIKGRITT